MEPPHSTHRRRQPWWRASSQRVAAARQERVDSHSDISSELALVIRAKRGGAREREELIATYQPLIASVARGYRRATAIERTELMQEGVVGLLRALQRYDTSRGVPFWAYATWWVRQAMQQVVSELSRPIVLSDRALRQLARIKEAQRTVEQTHGREACRAEVARLVGLPRAQVDSLICAERRPRPLDEPAKDGVGEAMTVGEQLADPPAEDAYELVPQRVAAAEVPRLLGHLNERERTVICSRYGIGGREHTLREVADRLAVSAERVRQIEQASLEKMCAVAARA